ncbi:MAG: hypothetical protein ACQEUF_09810 [Actinomycetota bacterium]
MSTDPVTLAREVLETAHEDETVTVCSVPDNKAAALARAVIDLTAKAKRMEALADRLDREASEYLGRPVHSQAGDRIRAALNGETND